MESHVAQSAKSCRQLCKVEWDSGCRWYTYDKETTKCMLYDAPQLDNCKIVYGEKTITPVKCGRDEFVIDQAVDYAQNDVVTSDGASCGEWYLSDCRLPMPVAQDNFFNRDNCQQFAKLHGDFFHYRTTAIQGFNCRVYEGQLKDVLENCNLRGGPRADWDEIEDDAVHPCMEPKSGCMEYMDGDCIYSGTLMELMSHNNADAMKTCAQQCDIVTGCLGFEYEESGKKCRLFDSNARICMSHFGTANKAPYKCGVSSARQCGTRNVRLKGDWLSTVTHESVSTRCECQDKCFARRYWTFNNRNKECMCYNGKVDKTLYKSGYFSGGINGSPNN